jgi:hypothetical protein
MNEVWCFDSTYWGYEAFEAWAQKGHSNNPRLFVYSTGGAGKKDTGDSAEQILTDSLPKPAAKPKRGAPPPPPPNPLAGTQIDVCVDGRGKHGAPIFTKYFEAAYHGSAGGHYESIEKYLTTLVETSQNLT